MGATVSAFHPHLVTMPPVQTPFQVLHPLERGRSAKAFPSDGDETESNKKWGVSGDPLQFWNTSLCCLVPIKPSAEKGGTGGETGKRATYWLRRRTETSRGSSGYRKLVGFQPSPTSLWVKNLWVFNILGFFAFLSHNFCHDVLSPDQITGVNQTWTRLTMVA